MQDLSKLLNEYINIFLKENVSINTTDEEVSQLKEILYIEFNQRINTFVLTSLPKEDLKQFVEILESGNQFLIHSFLVQKIPDFTTKLNEKVKDFYINVLNVKGI
jgi:hypothetical protein